MKEKILLVALVLFHLFVLSKLVSFPYPELFTYPFLAEGGLLPYRQILDQHFPSLLMLPFNFFDLGLKDPPSAKLFLLGTVVLSHFFIFVLAKKLWGQKHFLIPNLFFVLFQIPFDGRVLWLDSFLGLLLLLSFFGLCHFLENKKTKFLVLSALFLGLAFFFKQIVFPLILALAIYLYFETKSVKQVITFLLFSFIPVGLLTVWIFKKGLFADFYYWTFRFNFEVYGVMAKKLPTFKQFSALVFLLIPAFWVLWGGIKRKIMFPLILFLLLPLAGAVTRFEFIHVQPVIPFAALFVGSFFASLNKKTKLVFWVYSLIGIFLFLRFLPGHIGSEVYFFDEATLKTAQKVRELTENDERILVVGSQPVIYSLSKRLPAGRIFSVNLPWNMKVGEIKILESLKLDPPSLVVRDTSATIDGRKVSSFMQETNSFIDANYVLLETVGSNEILLPREKE